MVTTLLHIVWEPALVVEHSLTGEPLETGEVKLLTPIVLKVELVQNVKALIFSLLGFFMSKQTFLFDVKLKVTLFELSITTLLSVTSG